MSPHVNETVRKAKRELRIAETVTGTFADAEKIDSRWRSKLVLGRETSEIRTRIHANDNIHGGLSFEFFVLVNVPVEGELEPVHVEVWHRGPDQWASAEQRKACPPAELPIYQILHEMSMKNKALYSSLEEFAVLLMRGYEGT